jgi:hypothetical protein
MSNDRLTVREVCQSISIGAALALIGYVALVLFFLIG